MFGEVVLVGETDDIVAVSKPPSLPMHPCGAYRHNSLEYILKREHLVPNQPTLSVVHRLDRCLAFTNIVYFVSNAQCVSAAHCYI